MAAEGAGSRHKIPLGTAIGLLAIQCGVMIAVGLLLWHWSERDLDAFVTISGLEVLQGLAFGLAMIAIAFALFRGFPRIGETLVRMQADTYAFLGPRLGLPAIVFISLCAGVGEEALFRGGLQTPRSPCPRRCSPRSISASPLSPRSSSWWAPPSAPYTG